MKLSCLLLATILWLTMLPIPLDAQNININGQSFELDPNQAVSIDAATGDLTVSTLEDVVCSVGGASTPPTINGFSLSPAFASEADGTVQISAFYTTADATSCTGSGDPSFLTNSTNWGQTLLTQSGDGEQTFQVDAGALGVGSYTVRLTCDNTAGPRSASTTFDIVEESGGGDCAGTAPTNLTQDESIDRLDRGKKTVTFASVYGEFGGASTHDLRIDRNEYAALSFATTSQTDQSFGDISIFDTPATPEGPYVVSISACPGDFGPDLASGCRKLMDPGFFNSFNWETIPSFEDPDICSLDLNKSYYFNMVPAVELPDNRNPQWACGRNADGSPNTSAGSCAVKSTATEGQLQ